MALKKDNYPLVGFRYEVNIVSEIKSNEMTPGNISSLANNTKSTVDNSGFSEISGVTVTFETEDVEDAEGNIHYLPKYRKYTPLVLKRGLTGMKSDLVAWVAETIIGEKTQTTINTKSVIVKLLSDQGEPIAFWVFTGAYPTKWSVSGLKAMSNELVIEEMELKYKTFYPVFLG